jgi:hypothetical protein
MNPRPRVPWKDVDRVTELLLEIACGDAIERRADPDTRADLVPVYSEDIGPNRRGNARVT